MNNTFKEEVLKAIAKSKEDKIALAPIANRLQDKFASIVPENISVDTEEEVSLYASYAKVDGIMKRCVLILSINDDINGKELAVAITEKQALRFAQQLLHKYEQLNSINEELRSLGVE